MLKMTQTKIKKKIKRIFKILSHKYNLTNKKADFIKINM